MSAPPNEIPDIDEFRVLVIEDSEIDYEFARRQLARAERGNAVKFDLTHTFTLSEGLERIPDLQPDAILLDLHLPDAEGLPAVERVLADAVDVAIVVLTGNEDHGLALDSLRAGADDYLRKDDVTPELLCRSLLFSVERARHRVVEREMARERQERRHAGRIQANLLPKSTPRIRGFEIAGAYRPADKIGGDLFDVLAMPDGDVLCHVADVSGHNVGSALTMAGLRRVVRSLSPRVDNLVELVTAINEAVYEDTDAYQFVTQFLLRLDPDSAQFTYVGAAHVGYVLRSEGIWERLVSQVPPFGVMPELPIFEPTVVAMSPGDVVVLPTDGFIEAMDPTEQLWGSRRLEKAIRAHHDKNAQAMVSVLMETVLDYCSPGEPADDCSVVVLKRIES